MLNGVANPTEDKTGVYEDEDRQWWVVCPNPLTAVSCSTSEKIRVCPSDSRWGKWKKVTYTDKLSEGTTTPSPYDLPRAREMRSRFSGKMIPYLGRSGTVVDLLKDAVRMEINGARMLFDLDLFPKTIERVCLEGSCSLQPFLTSDTSFSCTSCLSQFGEGTPLFKCNDHTHTLCLFCCGLEPGVKKGMKVFRGPTWLWKDQDGGEYKQGTVVQVDNSHVTVKWNCDVNNVYIIRKPPFCDVVAAHDGEVVPDATKAEQREKHAKRRLEMLAKSYMPNLEYKPEKGLHFTNLLSSMKVSNGKKTVSRVAEQPCSVYIEECLTGSVTCSFVVAKLSPNGKMWFGIEEGKIKEEVYRYNSIGMRHSLSLCFRDNICVPLVNGKTGCREKCPPLKEGDVVSIVVNEGEISFFKNKELISGGYCFNSPKPYKFGVSIGNKGDSVSLIRGVCPFPILEKAVYNSENGFHFIGSDKEVTRSGSTSTFITKELLNEGKDHIIYFKTTVKGRVMLGVSGIDLLRSPDVALNDQHGCCVLEVVMNSSKAMMISGITSTEINLPSTAKTGDVYTIEVQNDGRLTFAMNTIPVDVYPILVNGAFRFGVSLLQQHDKVEILDDYKGGESTETELHCDNFLLSLLAKFWGSPLCSFESRSFELPPGYIEARKLLKQLKQDFKESDLSPIGEWITLGAGGFGTVYKAKYRGSFVAVKEQTVDDLDSYTREVKMTLELGRVPNAVKLIGIIPKRRMIVLKFYPDGDLRGHVKNGKLKTLQEKYKFMRTLVSSLNKMTSMNVVHRDLKPDNILIDDGEPVIADLGLAKHLESICVAAGTPAYIAPELFEGGDASEKSDVYSCAMIFYFILTGKEPMIPGNAWMCVVGMSDHSIGWRPSLDHPTLAGDTRSANILGKCWAHDPENRASFEDMIKMLTLK